jgi:hypothetical protein
LVKLCDAKTEVYSRVCGYFRPLHNWHEGKLEEYKDRKFYDANKYDENFETKHYIQHSE